MKKDRKNLDLKNPSGESDAKTKKFFLNSIAKYCDKCGTEYVQDNLQIVKKAPGQILLHIKCSNCGSENLVNFVQQLGLSSRAPFQSDLSIEELKKFTKLDAVSANEVLDVYDFLTSQKDLTAEKLLDIVKS